MGRESHSCPFSLRHAPSVSQPWDQSPSVLDTHTGSRESHQQGSGTRGFTQLSQSALPLQDQDTPQDVVDHRRGLATTFSLASIKIILQRRNDAIIYKNNCI